MPLKTCGACEKLVYPVDELKCLDKTWHKSCFKCQSCNMTLTMKNYKGYNKLPYCNAHYPTTKFTAVAETPEMARIAKNTKLQSQVAYHADFEAAKGHYTAVADDPETLRVRKTMETISNVTYHGELARKQEMESSRPTEIDAPEDSVPSSSAVADAPAVEPSRPPAVPRSAPRQPGSISDYDPMVNSEGPSSPYTNKPQSTTVFSSSSNSNGPVYNRSRRIGSIADYDPANDHYGSIVGQFTASKPEPSGESPVTGKPAPEFTPPIAAQRSTAAETQPQPEEEDQTAPPPQEPEEEPTPPPPEPEERSASPPPEPEERSASPPPEPEERSASPPPEPEERSASPPPEPENQQDITAPSPPPPEPEEQQTPAEGKTSRALYDYAAGDDDEISFNEHDIIINCEPIDDGWMNGTNKLTGRTGMLPSNYVEKINW